MSALILAINLFGVSWLVLYVFLIARRIILKKKPRLLRNVYASLRYLAIFIAWACVVILVAAGFTVYIALAIIYKIVW